MTTHDALIAHMWGDPQKKREALPIFADALQEEGMPGAHLAREAGKHSQLTSIGNGWSSPFHSLDTGKEATAPFWAGQAPRMRMYGGHPTMLHVIHAKQAPRSAPLEQHTDLISYRLPVRSLRHLHSLITDSPLPAQRKILAAAKPYLPTHDEPERLARPKGTHEHMAAEWRRNPDDDTTAGAYADALEEAGHTAPAHKLRYWLAVRKHLRSTDDLSQREYPRPRAVLSDLYNGLPKWLGRLTAVYSMRRTSPGSKREEAVRHLAERHALGLESDDRLQKVHEAIGLGENIPDYSPEYHVHRAMHWLTENNAPTRDLGIAASIADRGHAHLPFMQTVPLRVAEYVRANPPGEPERLARRKDTHEQMAAEWRRNPEDDTVAGAYADALEEAGHTAPAHRLRWWIGAKAHLRQHTRVDAPTDPTFTNTADTYAGLPPWLARLAAVHSLRNASPGDRRTEAIRHFVERHALGLEPDARAAAVHSAVSRQLTAHWNAGAQDTHQTSLEWLTDPKAPVERIASAASIGNRADEGLHRNLQYLYQVPYALKAYTNANPPPEPERLARPQPLQDQRAYHQAHGANLGLQPFSEAPSRLALDPQRSRVIALQYHGLQHDPTDPETKAAYEAFKRETLLQYQHMVNRGLSVEHWPHEGQPYANSKDMRDQVLRYKHLYVYPHHDLPADHPLTETVPGTRATYNSVFRAVHDYFGHVVHGNGFGPLGELHAWAHHARMYSPLARKAMTTETLGQNSWINFGPHKPEALPLAERPYAPQKAGVLKLARKNSDLGGYAKLLGLRGLRSGRTVRVGSNKTVQYNHGTGDIDVHLHGHRVVAAHPDGTFTLDHGGWNTPTTRRAISLVTGKPVTSMRGVMHIRHGEPASGSTDDTLSDYRPIRPGQRWHPETGYADTERDTMLRDAPAPVLADWLQDRGLPGAHIARADQPAANMPYVDRSRNYDPETGALTPARTPEAGKSLFSVAWRHGSPGAATVSMLHSHDNGPGLTVHSTNLRSQRQLYALLSDFPAAARKRVLTSLKGSAIPLTHSSDPPVRLARVVQGGMAEAVGQGDSANARKRLELAKRVLQEAGLHAHARPVLFHGAEGSRPAVLASAAHAGTQHALYAGAWLGMLTGEKAITVFHPGEGEDTMHVFDSPLPAPHVVEYLKKAGVPAFSTESKMQGTRVLTVAQIDDPEAIAGGLHASHTAVNGSADRIGSSTGADASTSRAAYRTIIADSESAAGFGKR